MRKTFNAKALCIRLKEYIVTHRHFRDVDLTREKAAKELGVPKAYVSRVMKENNGCSFSEYVNRQRIEYACTLLQSPSHSEYTIEEIALLSGFSCRMSFYRAYKKELGTTPPNRTKQLQHSNECAKQ